MRDGVWWSLVFVGVRVGARISNEEERMGVEHEQEEPPQRPASAGGAVQKAYYDNNFVI